MPLVTWLHLAAREAGSLIPAEVQNCISNGRRPNTVGGAKSVGGMGGGITMLCCNLHPTRSSAASHPLYWSAYIEFMLFISSFTFFLAVHLKYKLLMIPTAWYNLCGCVPSPVLGTQWECKNDHSQKLEWRWGFQISTWLGFMMLAERGEFILNGALRLFGRKSITNSRRTERLSVLLLSRMEYSHIMRLKMGNGLTQNSLCASQFPWGKLSYTLSKSKHNACFWLPRPKAPWDGLFNGCLYKIEMAPSLFSTQPVAEPGKGWYSLEVGDPVELLGSRKLQSHQFCAMNSRRLLKYANIAPLICPPILVCCP